MDQTISALRTSVVDDVHLCLRIADLLEALTSKIRQKFIPFAAQTPTSPQQTTRDSALFSGQETTNPSQSSSRNNPLYVRQPQGTSDGYDTSAGTQPGFFNSNITVMPPPRGFYSSTAYTNPQQYETQNTHQPPPQEQQQQQQQEAQQVRPNTYAANAPTPGSDFGLPREEDWLTLDLQPLLESNEFGAEADDSWFGSAFGPETHNNLEVLGKLVNEGWLHQEGGETGF